MNHNNGLDNDNIHHQEKIPRIIWSYWNSDEINWVVQLAQKTWQLHEPGMTILLLTPSTLRNYIQETALPPSFVHCTAQRQSDVIRLLLLEKYGGLWIDASLMISEAISPQWFPQNYDIGGYYSCFFTTTPNLPVFENWFISAPKGSPLVRAWKKEFFRGLTFVNPSDYIKQLENSGTNLQNILGKEYLMSHCSFLKVVNDIYNYSKISSVPMYNMKLMPASGDPDAPLSYLEKFNWSPQEAVDYLVNDKGHPPKLIKLRGLERDYLLGKYSPFTRSQKQLANISPNSIIARLIQQTGLQFR